ncbi:UDP-N-acetylmuramate dehydrogenase [Faecalicatena contorta]|uniref:UDP-N-acetylenolpyruvoylglucosamine reductase n=1 Tax=Faecalicatena contorta TaxID=39482 RepID=A0A315ZPS8_9FIRM|nr:UDP-N-acetylmuramate dehydrogenase [Faecalicatena contorta]PWJ47526.1 UDP-N-acetylmuramate dehydrogenase [Faecalicatena contorta]SUQ15915.1 UDP-N-acetylmuramate dehydrogenase [Faecalicatena contorta]
MALYEELCDLLGEDKVLIDEPMSRHTTFRVGGPADYFVIPEGPEEIKEVITLLKREDIPYYILGNGSNLLVGDKGYRGVIIQMYKNLNRIDTKGNQIYAQAGALLSKIAAEAQAQSLTGFEFASGIPGTMGGAVMMNAGAYGGEMSHVLVNATILTQEGVIKTLTLDELELGYRTSIIARNGYVVLEAVISLEPGNPEEIHARMEELKEKRVTKQPLEYASAGSTFKRPEGYFAGKLIEDAGLRGFRVGNAQVSAKHCGFVINRGGATAAEIVALMDYVADKVEAVSGVRLKPEVKRIGEF